MVRAFVGRVLYALIFLSSGANKIQTFGSDGGPALKVMAPKLAAAKAALSALTGVDVAEAFPLSDVQCLQVAVFLEVAGAALFILDVPLGARLLAVFLLVVTPVMHDFWTIKDPTSPAFLVDQIMFMKNLAMLGALQVYLALKSESRRLKTKLD